MDLVSPATINLSMMSNNVTRLMSVTIAQMVSRDTSHVTLLMNNSNVSLDKCHVMIIPMIQVTWHLDKMKHYMTDLVPFSDTMYGVTVQLETIERIS